MGTIAVVWSGFVAIVVSIAFFWLLRSLRATQFSPTVQLGCLLVPNPSHPVTETIGFALLVALGSTVIPLAYNALFHLARGPSALAGLGVGALHGLLTAAALPALGTISACIRAGSLPEPGPFGIRWGWLTPPGLVAGHALYGAIYGAVLASF